MGLLQFSNFYNEHILILQLKRRKMLKGLVFSFLLFVHSQCALKANSKANSIPTPPPPPPGGGGGLHYSRLWNLFPNVFLSRRNTKELDFHRGTPVP